MSIEWLRWHSPGSSVGKEPACTAGDPGSIPGLGRYPGKEMATYYSIFAWRFQWTEEPGGLWSSGSQRDKMEATQHKHACTDRTMISFQIAMLLWETIFSWKPEGDKLICKTPKMQQFLKQIDSQYGLTLSGQNGITMIVRSTLC